MFNYSQEDVNNLKINNYKEEESKKMLDFLSNNDFLGATESLEKGADPNFIKWNAYNNEIEHLFSHILYSLWNNGAVTSLLEIDEDELEGNDSFSMFKKFFSVWKEKGGDINKKSLVFKPGDSQSYYNDYPLMCSLSDFINEHLFISTKNNNNKDQSYYLHHTFDILNVLTNINEYFIPVKIDPVYQNQSLLGLLTREGWSYNQNDLLKLLNEEHSSFLIDEKGDTPLHYSIDLKTQCNYYLKNVSFHSNSNYLDIGEYIDNYSKYIEQNFTKETLLIKNKENLIPLEKMFQEKSYAQAISLASLMIKNDLHHNCFNEIDFSLLSMENIKKHYPRYKEDLDKDQKLNAMIVNIHSYIEKSIINKSLIQEELENTISSSIRKRI